MTPRIFVRWAATAAIVLAAPRGAAAQDPCVARAAGKLYSAWVNCRIERMVVARGGPGGDDKQAETPSISDDSSTLIDTTSASDFIGLGMTLVKVRDTHDTETTSGTTAATVTGYSLLAAAYGRDPLKDPDFYYSHANWRRVILTIGRQPRRDEGRGLDAEATIAGAKFVFWNTREIARDENVANISTLLTRTAVSTAAINTAINELLWAALAPTKRFDDFVSTDLGQANFEATLRQITQSVSDRIDAAIGARIGADVALRDAITDKVREIKRRPQASIAWASNLRDEKSPDEHRFEVLVDYGVAPRLSFTANAGWDLIDRKKLTLDPTLDENVGRVAAALQMALADTGALGLRPAPRMSFSGDVQWKHSQRSWEAQWKFDLPVAGGILLPISFTWADRPELIHEKEVRGTVGFTIDTAKLAAALR